MFCASAPLFNHLHYGFRRILPVNIDRDYGIATSLIKACGCGGFFAEITGKVNDFNCFIVCLGFDQVVECSIGAAVINE